MLFFFFPVVFPLGESNGGKTKQGKPQDKLSTFSEMDHFTIYIHTHMHMYFTWV